MSKLKKGKKEDGFCDYRKYLQRQQATVKRGPAAAQVLRAISNVFKELVSATIWPAYVMQRILEEGQSRRE